MPPKALTAVAARNAQPKEKAYKLAAGGGLYLEVQPNGNKYWRWKYRYDGKEKRLALGVFPEVSLSDAGGMRDAARKQLKDGQDPGEARKTEKRARKAKAGNHFEAVAREWHEAQQGRWSKGHAEKVITSLEDNVFKPLGACAIAEITGPELLDVLRVIERRGALETAHKVLQRCGAIFRYGIATGRCERDVAADLRGALKTRKVTHMAALGRDDLPAFLRKLEAYDGHPQTRLALELVLYTFVRTNELRAAKWSEFDLERAEWRIPAERMKMGSEHIVPLSTQAVAVLEALKPLSANRELVFPSKHYALKPMSYNTMLFAMYRMGYHSQATVHGFRATASTILNETGFKPDVIERQLAHVERNKVRAAYHRSEYLDDRKKMMQWWADYLDGLKSGAKVISFRNTA